MNSDILNFGRKGRNGLEKGIVYRVEGEVDRCYEDFRIEIIVWIRSQNL